MSIVNYDNLLKTIIGSSVPKPISGTLSGHAAGEPFDKHVYSELKKVFPKRTFRQYEYFNDLFSKNPSVITFEDRLNLFNSPTVMFLLSRGKSATTKWSIDNPFEEKQNDTADILVVDNNFYEIIDIKTRNISKKAQPPNIISAYKLAQTCAKIENGKRDFDEKRLPKLAKIFKLDLTELRNEYVTDQIEKQIYETNCTKQLSQVAEEKAEYRRTLKEKVI